MRPANPNPRVGVLLEYSGASPRLKNALWRFRMRGLVWLAKHWPEKRLRGELAGYGPACGREWREILGRRGQETKK